MVSVVITCFNYGRYLAGCIESALAQTAGDLEVVVVNDGSTDDSENVAKRYLSDPRVRYVAQARGGQARAKNSGAALARGEFVAFLDADDLWDESKLERQLPLFRPADVAVVYSRSRYIDEAGREVEYAPVGEHLTPRRGRVAAHLIFDNFVPFSSSVVRTAAFRQAGGFDASLEMGIDWDLWLRLSVRHEFDFVDAPLLLYRLGHSGQMSRNRETRMECSDRILKSFLGANPGLLSARTVRRAWSYAYVTRGYFCYTIRDFARSNRFYLRAIRECWWDAAPYRGLLRNAFRSLVRRS